MLLAAPEAMPDVEVIEEAVNALPPQDIAKFRSWFAEFDATACERRPEKDIEAGTLDALLEEAVADYRWGLARGL